MSRSLRVLQRSLDADLHLQTVVQRCTGVVILDDAYFFYDLSYAFLLISIYYCITSCTNS